MQYGGQVLLGGGLLINPMYILAAEQAYDQATLGKMQDRMVKLLGRNHLGQLVATFSGFILGPSLLYNSTSDHHGLIVTAGHALHFGDPGSGVPTVDRFQVKYSDGIVEDVKIIVYPPGGGQAPDLMLLEGSRSMDLMQADMGSANSIVYALGFDALQQLACNRGSMASTTPGAVSITAHADNGFSGGPVVDLRCRLVGIIRGPLGVTNFTVGITPACDLQTVLWNSGHPGLQAA